MIAGIGLREQASLEDLEALLALAPAPLTGLATLALKITHPALIALRRDTGLPLYAVARADLAGIPTLTNSPDQIARFATGSLAEACALFAAGPGARLTAPRQISPSGRATIAFATRNPL